MSEAVQTAGQTDLQRCRAQGTGWQPMLVTGKYPTCWLAADSMATVLFSVSPDSSSLQAPMICGQQCEQCWTKRVVDVHKSHSVDRRQDRQRSPPERCVGHHGE